MSTDLPGTDVRPPVAIGSPRCDPRMRERLDALIGAEEPVGSARQPWTFTLRLSGPYGFGVEDPLRGAQVGAATRVRARLRLTVEVLGADSQGARLTGTFRSGALGGKRPLRHGAALVLQTDEPPSLQVGYQLHLAGWENVPVTVRGQLGTALAPHAVLPGPALSLELWRDASGDGSEPEELIASGLLHVGPWAALRAAAGFCRTAPPGTQPVRLLAAGATRAWRQRARSQR